jgi:uncharacterized protein (DUF433 family)
MAGKPVIAGTRVTVERILDLLAQGMKEEEIVKEFERVTLADIRAALVYAARLASSENVFPAFVTGKR